ncbi:MAG: 50S ribosomal protein L25 [Candidatus Taylorbacteria bacterium]
MLTLHLEKRDGKIKLAKLRKGGKLPAVYYGPKEKSTSVSVSATEFKKVWKQVGESSIISLKDGKDEHDALIKDVDVDPVSGVFRHADFYVVEKGKKLQVSVPLVFEGVSPAVKDLGGILVKVIHELKIEAIPKDLPHTILVNISSLSAFDSRIQAKDLQLPTGVSLVINPDDVIASVAQPREEKEEEVVPVDLSQIEISEKKGKEEKEGEEGEVATAPNEGGKEAKKDTKDTK